MKNFCDLSGKNAIVVGGGTGIGRGIAEGLASAGAHVVIASRRLDVIEKAAREMSEATGGTVDARRLDLSTVDAIEAFVAAAASDLGHIDILVNSAGINIRKPILEFGEDDWDKVTDTQLKYVFFMSRAVARHMSDRGIRGRIINIGSLNCVFGFKNIVAYVASKGGVMQMTKAFANELGPKGITVNAIGPGWFRTEMTEPLLGDPETVKKYEARIPMGRLGSPSDVAPAAVFFASDAAAYVTGQMLYVDGGWLTN